MRRAAKLALVLVLAGLPFGCDLLVGVKEVHDSSPASAAASAGSGGSGAGGTSNEVCTTVNVAEKCGMNSACRSYACELGLCASKDAAAGAACSEGKGASCDGKGKCIPPESLELGSACGIDGQCKSQSCVDGVCCDDQCTGSCRGCNKALTGKPNGTCAAVVPGVPQPGVCDAAHGACNGSCACAGDGSCKLANGQKCLVKTQCGSGFCVDGVCCDSACTSGCAACSKAAGAEADGSCTQQAVKSDTDPGACDVVTEDGVCDAAPCICDKGGKCKGQQGSGCNVDIRCVTLHCADGVCCNSACLGPCSACSVNLGATVNGKCLPNVVKNMPDSGSCDAKDGTCATPPCTCDSGGLCKNDLTAECSSANECASGKCCPVAMKPSVCCP